MTGPSGVPAGRAFAAEAAEIPDAVGRLLHEGGDAAAAAAEILRGASGGLAICARGSSLHAADLVRHTAQIATGRPGPILSPALVTLYAAPLRAKGAAALFVSQSGAAPDLVEMARAWRLGGGRALALTNTPEAPLASACDRALLLGAGPERAVTATKTVAASAVAGLMVWARAAGDGRLAAALDGLPAALTRAAALDWSPLSRGLAEAPAAAVLARGPALAIAGEVALKLKEAALLPAEAMSAAEVMHGPAALARPGYRVLALASEDAAAAPVAEAAAALAAMGADVYLAGGRAAGARILPSVATGHPATDALALLPPFYRALGDLARRRGVDPDAPPNLAKITRTR